MAAKKTTATKPTSTSTVRKLASFAPADIEVFELELSDGSTVEMQGLMALDDAKVDVLADALDAFGEATKAVVDADDEGSGGDTVRSLAKIRRAGASVIRASIEDPERAEAVLADPAMRRVDALIALVSDFMAATASGESSSSDE